jgi:hypothetical protein
MTKRLPRSFIITKPRLRSVVVVHSDPRRPFRAVVTDLLVESPEKVRVRPLDGSEEVEVEWRILTHGAV